MRVLIDASCLFNERRTGVEFYAENIIINLLQQLDQSTQVLLLVNTKKRVKDYYPQFFSQKNFHLANYRKNIGYRRFFVPLMSWLWRANISIFPISFAGRLVHGKCLTIIYDLAAKKFPQFFTEVDLRQQLKTSLTSIQKADGIITISENTKLDILENYGVRKEKVVVAPCALGDDFPEDPRADLSFLERKKIKKDYLLFLGAHHRRKNLINTIKAFSLLTADSQFDIDLVVVGKGQELYAAEIKAIDRGRIFWFDYVSKEDKVQFYKHARLFIFPSFYEGFGIPLLEAFCCGTPVIASATSSLPEVAGDAAEYVDPVNPQQIAEKIRLLLQNKERANQLVTNGFCQLKKFNYQESAKKICLFLEKFRG